MQSDTKHNGRSTDTTSKAAAKLSETEYLAREAGQARLAMSDTIAEMRTSLMEAADPRAWARKYPLPTVGAAAVAGFMAALAVVPKRKTGEEEMDPSLLQRILADEQIADRVKELADEDETPKRAAGVVQSVASTLFQTFGPAIQRAITTAMVARAAAPDADEMAEAARDVADDERAQAESMQERSE